VSPRLPVVSGREAITALRKAGFAEISQRGSHVKLRNAEGRTAIVPLHRELAPGTLRSVLRQAAMSVEDFTAFL
jgi:predicted RNA binding protein YcfA (HicA-like mRNA interferase family)